MRKSDISIHNICVASIKRSTMEPYDFKWTKFYESNMEFLNSYSAFEIEFSENEFVICSTIIDNLNYSILTTQKLLTKENGEETVGNMNCSTDKSYGNFKGYGNENFTFGLINLENGDEMKYFIETGKASMVMVYGIKTRISVDNKSET